MRLLIGILALFCLLVACGDDDLDLTTDSSTTSTTSTAPSTSTTTAAPTSSTTSEPSSTTVTTTTEPAGPVLAVEDLFDGEGPRDAQVISGFVVWDSASARLCDVLMESFPPQCGWAWIVLANPDGLDVELTEEQGVRWTDDRVEIEADFDGTRLVLRSASEIAQPTEADVQLVESFVEFARDPSPAKVAEVPFAAQVAIGLSDSIEKTVPVESLSDPLSWSMDRDEYDGYAGPFSVLDLEVEERPLDILVGAHPRCAAAPVPPPTGFEDHRRVSVQPSDATSCLEWFTVDFFINEEGLIDAVALDLFGP